MILSRKQLRRVREIGSVLVKYGWGQAISRLGLAAVFHYEGPAGAKLEPPQQLLKALRELGPTFVKLGQILSTRPDLLPADYIAELSKLQDTAPTIPFSEVESVIESSLGQRPDELFAQFNREPLAAASLGQVHEARLADGSHVIVKVQRPGVVAVVSSDIEILHSLANLLEHRWDPARTYGLTEIVDEFAITIREELDYTREAYNTDRLRHNLESEKEALVPEVHWDLTATRVLTVQMVEGVKITDMNGLDSIGADRKTAASNLSSVFLKQIFIDGFFHADPHPGNIIVTPEQQIALIDAGQVRQLDAAGKSGLIRLLIAFEHKDTRQFAEEIMAIGIARTEIDLPLFTYDLERILRQYYDLPSSVVSIGQLLTKVMEVSARHKVRLPTSFAVLGKVLADIDGINRQLDPSWNFTEAARPYITRSVKDQLKADEILSDTYRALIDTKSFLLNLPEYLNQLFRRAVEGSIRVEFKHKGLDQIQDRLDRSVNRLAFAMIVAATIIGSAVITTTKAGPMTKWGVPALGVAGYVTATVFGIWLLLSISRSGRL